MLDLEKEKADKQQQSNEVPAQKDDIKYNKKLTKLSKFKTKLSGTKIVKKYKKKLGPKIDKIDNSPDYSDPLLALS